MYMRQANRSWWTHLVVGVVACVALQNVSRADTAVPYAIANPYMHSDGVASGESSQAAPTQDVTAEGWSFKTGNNAVIELFSGAQSFNTYPGAYPIVIDPSLELCGYNLPHSNNTNRAIFMKASITEHDPAHPDELPGAHVYLNGSTATATLTTAVTSPSTGELAATGAYTLSFLLLKEYEYNSTEGKIPEGGVTITTQEQIDSLLKARQMSQSNTMVVSLLVMKDGVEQSRSQITNQTGTLPDGIEYRIEQFDLTLGALGEGESYAVEFNFSIASGSTRFSISNVSLTASVPEPATWAMVVGMGGVGLVAVRRWRRR